MQTALGHHRAGRWGEAEAIYRQVLAVSPDHADAVHLLGVAAMQTGRLGEAHDLLQRAVALRPDAADCWINLGNVRRKLGRVDEAITAFRVALRARPESPEGHNNLGNALRVSGQLDEAIAAYRQALRLRRRYPQAEANLGNALKDAGDLDGALAAYRRAMRLAPASGGWHGNYLAALSYHPAYSDADIRREAAEWDRTQVQLVLRKARAHANDPAPDRPLRIGYLSPYFRRHVNGRLLLPVLRQIDREQFRTCCYSCDARADEATVEFRRHADEWRELFALDDDAAAEQIRQDGIDILVDCAMHLAGGRPMVLARKPAPIQIEWLGYPGTTGSSAVDYRLSDRWLEPEIDARAMRLADSFWCYEAGADVAVGPLPAEQNGFITFGCLNNFCKVNAGVLGLWGQVLRGVARSRLILLCPSGQHRQRVIEQLGVERDRVEFVPLQPELEYLRTYHRIDIALDTFPYNGHTTSMDALWMGVPVVTRIGTTVAGRAGWSQLNALGCAQWAATDDEQFVRIAVELSADVAALGSARRALRATMQASTLCDAGKFARELGNVYRLAWRRWGESSRQGGLRP